MSDLNERRAAGHGLAAFLLLRQMLADVPAARRRRVAKAALLELESLFPAGPATTAAKRLLVGMLAREWPDSDRAPAAPC
jgi:hypothetical protein